MLTSAHIRNYRGLRDLEIPELRRVNVFTGSNDAGKTSLLEALFLVTCSTNPSDHLNAHIFKDISVDHTTTHAAQDTLWKSLHSGLDDSKEIAICVQDSVRGTIKLTLNPDKPYSKVPPSMASYEKESRNQVKSYAIDSRLQSPTDIEDQISPSDTDEQITREKGKSNGILCSSMFASRTGLYGPSFVKKLESIDMKNHELSVVSALKLFDPNIRNVRSTFASGQFRLSVDIGIGEFLPVAMLGSGMQSVAQMMISLITIQDGLLLVDEFENGIHHSLLTKVWRAIYDASISTNAQIIATTHSYECISAIYESLSPEEFRVHRLESTDLGNRCVTYSSDAISGSMQHGFDVR